ncbi:MAG: CRISPR-associated endoribonuclease Cas6 [Anaerostipes caccae]
MEGVFSLQEYEKRLTVNLVKKYNAFCDTKINEDFEFIRMIEVKNRTPITVSYKKIKLLGDKIALKVADNELSQELSYMTLGTGLGEINARGAGFVNYRWM